MRYSLLFAGICAAIVAGCATPYATKLPDGLSGLPYRVEPVVDSAIPESYIVMTGPAETYRSYRFNERFRSAAETYASVVSEGREAVEARITLTALQTEYDEVGATDERPYPLAGSNTILGPLRLTSFGSFNEDHGDMNIPLEIIKTATLSGTVEIRRDERVLKTVEIMETQTVIVEYLDYRPGSYDYFDVFDAVIRSALWTVDGALRSALAAE